MIPLTALNVNNPTILLITQTAVNAVYSSKIALVVQIIVASVISVLKDSLFLIIFVLLASYSTHPVKSAIQFNV